MYKLLKNSAKWIWSAKQVKTFQQAKDLIQSPQFWYITIA